MSTLSRKALGAVVYLAFLGLFVEVALQGFYYFTAGDFLFRRVGLAGRSSSPAAPARAAPRSVLREWIGLAWYAVRFWG